jgi:hypothetical protein
MGAMQIYRFNLHKIVAISGSEIEHEHRLMFPECSLSQHIISRPRHVASMATKQALHGAFLCLVQCVAAEKIPGPWNFFGAGTIVRLIGDQK